MNILLVNPPESGRSILEEQYGITALRTIFKGEPLGLEELAGNLVGHTVEIVDFKADAANPENYVPAIVPDIIGITSLTCEAPRVLEMAALFKARFHCIIVVGGPHASLDPDFFNVSAIDFIALGLAKLSFRELVDALERGEKTPVFSGIASSSVGKPLVFEKRHFSQADLVEHALPRYDLLDRYRSHYVMRGLGSAGFVASAMGCTHDCAFCSIHSLTSGRYFSVSTDTVISSMKLLGSIPAIRLVDANTFGNVKKAEVLAQSIIESDMKKALVVDVRSDTVVKNPELFKLWRKAGLVGCVIGFEEIDDKRLSSFNKKNTSAANEEAIKILHDYDIKIVGDFIVSPDYTQRDFDALATFVERTRVDIPVPSILTPIPGTSLYAAMRQNIVIHDLAYYTFFNAVVSTSLPEQQFYEAYAGLLSRFLGSHRQERT